jgi:hypothetical protein
VTTVGTGLKILSNKIAPDTTSDYHGAAWNTSFNADMESHVVIATIPTLEATLSLGCVVRLQANNNANADHYEIAISRVAAGNDQLQLYRVAASGTYTFLVAFNLSGDITAGDVIGIAAYGSLIVGFYNGTAVMAIRDTTITAGGYAALIHYLNGAGEFGAFGGGNVANKLRLYLPSSGAPAISPAFDGIWGDTEDADRIAAVSTPSDTAMANKTSDEAVSTSPLNVLARQYIYGPIPAGTVISGTARGVIRVLENNAAANAQAQLKIRGVDSAGANPSTLLDVDTTALANEFPTSAASRLFPKAWTSPILTPWTVPSGGGYLVIEIGCRCTDAATTGRTHTFRFGDTTANTDRLEDETATTDTRPWIEFSDVGAVTAIEERDGTSVGAATVSGVSGKIAGVAGTAAGSAVASGQALDLSLLEHAKIVFPSDGVLWGCYQWMDDDIDTFETVCGIPASHYHEGYGNWGSEFVSGHPHLDVTAANAAWSDGKVIVTSAYNLCATDDPGETEHPSGFTVDKLLDGDYDSNLETFADELRSFGKPCFIQCGREPNGIGWEWFGGWGPNGDQDTAWAMTNEDAYENFVPPAPPSGAPSNLYDGCSGPTMPDGIGRLKAGQRYIHDFLVRREGLNFLTFDSQGFTCHWWKDASDNQLAFDSLDFVGHESYAIAVLEDCNDPAKWFPGAAYCDYWSLTFYPLDYYDAWWTWLSGSDILRSNADWITSMEHMLDQIAAVNSLPIGFVEFGLCDGMNENTTRRASKVTDILPVVLNDHPQVKMISNWTDLRPPEEGAWTVVDFFPYLCLIQPGTLEATALQNVIAANPTKFVSYASFSNGFSFDPGSAVEERDGSAAGAGLATGSSADLEARTGSGVGAGTSTGQSGATAGRAGSSAGQGQSTGQAAAVQAEVGTSVADAEAEGVSARIQGTGATSEGSGSAFGDATDAGAEGADGSSTGLGTASGQSARLEGQQGSAQGAAEATGASGRTVGTEGDSEGAAAVSGESGAIVGREGAASGDSTAAGAGAGIDGRSATSTGVSDAQGQSGKIVGSGPTIAGTAEAIGDPADAGAVGEEGTSAGQALATGQSARIDQQAGSAASGGEAIGSQAELVSRQGSAAGEGEADGIGARVDSRAATSDGIGEADGASGRIVGVSGASDGQGVATGVPVFNPIRRTLEVEFYVAAEVMVDVLVAESIEELIEV